MANIKATVGINPSTNLKAKISSNRDKLRAQTIGIGTPVTLNDMTDIDMSAKEQGAMLVWDATAGQWKAKQTLADGTSFEGGHY
jgi:hypothetical protein